MKKIVLTLSFVLFALPAFAIEPNRYECKNENTGFDVTYSTTSFSGSPQFTYVRNVKNEIPGFPTPLTEITSDNVKAIGKVVSGMLSDDLNGSKVYVSLLLPDVTLSTSSTDWAAEFPTKLILTTAKIPADKPSYVVTQSYKSFNISCKATRVLYIK